MQDCRGKRILRLSQLNNENLSKKPKVIVHSVVTLNSCTTSLLEKEILQQQTKQESHVGSNRWLDLLISNGNSSKEGVLEDQAIEETPVRLEESVTQLDLQKEVSLEDQDSKDAFEASDEDEEYDPNKEEDNNSDTSEDTEAPKEGNSSRSRWNKADDRMWNRNLTKKCRNLGQPYTTKKGRKPAKAPQYVNCNGCRFKCSMKFSEAERIELCSSYWQLELYSRKKDFFLKNVKATIPQRQRHRKKNAKSRSNAKEFYLLKDGAPTRVCQKFFLKTLSISNGPLNKAFENKNETSGLYQGDDKRGRHVPFNKISQEEKNIIKNHIESFPLTDSHYCRKSSQRKYLDATLSIAKMYSLYKIMCEEKAYIPRSMTTYKRIFSEEYNYSFFKPRKDQCSLCMRYQTATGDQKTALESMYLEHKKRETDANNSKKNDKERASAEPNFVTATFDLQSVLQIPSSDVSPMYYSRKLCGYNLTIYEGAPPNNAFCYTWTEVNGARGSLEIATCLYRYLHNLPDHVTEVSFFSDTCGGQNRNQNVLAMLYYFVHFENSQIVTIEQKFLKSGHSMMECDSMHSAIEKQKRYLAVYTMNDWVNIFKMARSKRGKKKNDPYIVQELRYSDFLDFKAISQAVLKNRTVNTQGEKVKWLKIKCFRIEKDNPDVVKYKYNHLDDYLCINISGRGRPSTSAFTLNKAYSAMLPISVQKYNDLKKLCTNEVIPSEFHQWYLSLPTSNTVKNQNAEPSVDSESEED